MTNKISLKKFSNLLKATLAEYTEVVLAVHIDADPDAIGSALALTEWLESMGKKVSYFTKGQYLSDRFFSMPGFKKIEQNLFTYDEKVNPLFILLDTGSANRLAIEPELLSKFKSFEIDHHSANTGLATTSYIDPKATSTAEIIYYLFKHLQVSISNAMAANLLAGISTDTDGYRHYPTSHKTFRAASELAKKCPNFHKYILKLRDTITPGSIEFLKLSFNKLEYYFHERVVFLGFSLVELNAAGITPAEALSQRLRVVNILRSIKGCSIIVCAVETEKDLVKTIYRSTDPSKYNLVKLVEHTKLGGGHPTAIGLHFNESYNDAKDTILKGIATVFPKLAQNTLGTKKSSSKLLTKEDLYSLLQKDTLFGAQNVTFIYLDGDYQKDINLVFGRTAGDRHIGIIKNIVLGLGALYKGLTFKIGGDEFVLLLGSNFKEEAVQESLDELQRNAPFHDITTSHPLLELLKKPAVTMSYSNIALPLSSNDINVLIEAMDVACTKKKIEKYRKLDPNIASGLTRNVSEVSYKSLAENAFEFDGLSDKSFILDRDMEHLANNPRLDKATLLPNKLSAETRINKAFRSEESIVLLYFDMVAIKDIHRLFGRETFGVPVMLGVYFLLNTLAKLYKGVLYRIGGDEGLIVFSNHWDAEKFQVRADEELRNINISAWSDGYILGQRVRDYDKKEYACFDASRLNEYPSELVSFLLPPKITWVLTSLNDLPIELLASKDVSKLLDYFEKTATELKRFNYMNLPSSLQKYISRKLY